MFLLHRAGLIAALCVVALLLLAPPTHAQDAPPAVRAALDALNADRGTNLTLNDLASWEWTRQQFPDRSLDCPREGFSYPEFETNGYIVELVYENAVYDYRVYTNTLEVFQCTPNGGAPGGTPLDGSPAPDATSAVTPVPTGAQAATPTPPALTPTQPTTTTIGACPEGLPPRLTVGMRGESIAAGSINIRETAGLDDQNAIQGLLLPGGAFDVIGGPQCVDGRTWWQIRYESAAGTTIGWVIQGDDAEYWLAPLDDGPTDTPPPTAAPATNTPAALLPITVDNVAQLVLVGRFPVSQGITQTAFLPPPTSDAVIIDPQGQLHYFAGETVARLALDLNHVDAQARHVTAGPVADSTATRIATVETAPDGSGAVLYVSTVGGSPLAITDQYGFQLPHLPNDLVFSPDGRYLAASSGSVDAGEDDTPATEPLPNLVWLWDATSGQQLPTIQLDGPAADLAFSPDGRYLAITRPVSGVVLWSMETSSEVVRLFNTANWRGTPSLAFNPDGRTLAVGTLDGEVIRYNLRDPENVEALDTIDAYTDAEVRFVVFNRTGTLLATGGIPRDAEATSGDTATGSAETNAGIAVWNTTDGEQLMMLETELAEPLTGIAFRGTDGTELIATGSAHWWVWGVF